jgi:hypothetical protein
MALGGAPYQMVPGGASIRRSTDRATDGLTDDRTRHGDDDRYGKDADPAMRGGPHYLLAVRKHPEFPNILKPALLESSKGK